MVQDSPEKFIVEETIEQRSEGTILLKSEVFKTEGNYAIDYSIREKVARACWWNTAHWSNFPHPCEGIVQESPQEFVATAVENLQPESNILLHSGLQQVEGTVYVFPD